MGRRGKEEMTYIKLSGDDIKKLRDIFIKGDHVAIWDELDKHKIRPQDAPFYTYFSDYDSGDGLYYGSDKMQKGIADAGKISMYEYVFQKHLHLAAVALMLPDCRRQWARMLLAS